jgi:hypothetical protein
VSFFFLITNARETMQLACQPQPIEMKRRESAESGSMLSKMMNDEQEAAWRDATIEVDRLCSTGRNKPDRKVP